MPRTAIAVLNLDFDKKLCTIDVPDPCRIVGAIVQEKLASAIVLRSKPRTIWVPALLAIVDPTKPRKPRTFRLMSPLDDLEHNYELAYCAHVTNPVNREVKLIFQMLIEAHEAETELVAPGGEMVPAHEVTVPGVASAEHGLDLVSSEEPEVA